MISHCRRELVKPNSKESYVEGKQCSLRKVTKGLHLPKDVHGGQGLAQIVSYAVIDVEIYRRDKSYEEKFWHNSIIWVERKKKTRNLRYRAALVRVMAFRLLLLWAQCNSKQVSIQVKSLFIRIQGVF